MIHNGAVTILPVAPPPVEFQLKRFGSLSGAFLAHGPGAFVWGLCGDREFLIIALPGEYIRVHPTRRPEGDAEKWMNMGPPGWRYAGDRDRPEFDKSLDTGRNHVRIRDGVLKLLA